MDYFWTDATGHKWHITEMETSHLINVAKTIWDWSMKRFEQREKERKLYEAQATMLPGFDAIERIEPDLFDYTADRFDIFEPICEELHNRHIRVVEENGVLHFDDMRIQND